MKKSKKGFSAMDDLISKNMQYFYIDGKEHGKECQRLLLLKVIVTQIRLDTGQS